MRDTHRRDPCAAGIALSSSSVITALIEWGVGSAALGGFLPSGGDRCPHLQLRRGEHGTDSDPQPHCGPAGQVLVLSLPPLHTLICMYIYPQALDAR
jgi:hypothetical protein